MTDTTINESTVASLGEVVKNQTSNVERIENAIMAFSNTVIQALTGASTTTVPKAASVAPATGAKRRGRPVGSKNRSKAALQAAGVARVPHPTEVQIMNLVDQAGCMTQSELADALKIERALIQNHTDPLLESGKIKCMYWKRPGEHRHLAYYRPDWVKERSRVK